VVDGEALTNAGAVGADGASPPQSNIPQPVMPAQDSNSGNLDLNAQAPNPESTGGQGTHNNPVHAAQAAGWNFGNLPVNESTGGQGTHDNPEPVHAAREAGNSGNLAPSAQVPAAGPTVSGVGAMRQGISNIFRPGQAVAQNDQNSNTEIPQADSDCNVCRQTLRDGRDTCTAVHRNSTNHENFHYECMARWFDQIESWNRSTGGKNCPMCRQDVIELHRRGADGSVSVIHVYDTYSHTWPFDERQPNHNRPPSDVSMQDAPNASAQDASLPPNVTAEGRDPRESDPAYVKDEDRSSGEEVWKKIIAIFVARRSRQTGDVLASRFLLESDGKNPAFPTLKIHELEAQSRFPGAIARYENRYGSMTYQDPSPIADLDGTDWDSFEVTGFANVYQNLRVVDDRVLMPKAQALAIVRLKYAYEDIAENWYQNSAVERRFGAIDVRAKVNRHRDNTKQHRPIMPERQRGVTVYTTRPISQ
jgi:hypothetical protein